MNTGENTKKFFVSYVQGCIYHSAVSLQDSLPFHGQACTRPLQLGTILKYSCSLGAKALMYGFLFVITINPERTRFPLIDAENAYGEELRSEQVKAALIFNFAKFIQWPKDYLHNEENTIIFGVVGAEAIAEELGKIVSMRTVGGRRARVKYYRDINEVEPTHILYIDKREEAELLSTLRALKDGAVLTVGEGDEFLDLGGIIKFVFRGDRVRFAINKKAATEAHLHISLELFSLADQVVE